MTCREVVEFLLAYRSGELPTDERREFEAHLEACPDCVAYLKSYDRAVKLGKTVLRRSDESVPPQVPGELLQAILAARRRAN